MSDLKAETAAPPEPADPGFVTYTDAILRTLERRPALPVIICPDRRQITAGELRDSIHRLARELITRGVRPGQTVSLLTGNTPQALVARYAANLAGARVTPLYDGLNADALAHLMDVADTEMLLADPTRYADLDLLKPFLHAPMVATLGPHPDADDIWTAAAGQPSAPVAVPVGADDDWCIRHTGGTTTGLPKSLQMKHGPYRRTLDHLCSAGGAPPRYLACTPLTHIAGLWADVALLQGGSVVLQPAFDPGEALAAIERERITRLFLQPPLLHRLLDDPALPATDTSSVQQVTYGGSPASTSRLRQTESVFGKVLHSWYGQNETLGLTEVGPDEHDRVGRHGQITVGRAMPGVELRVVDRDGSVLPRGSEGEIHARAHSAMNGYWKQPELTAHVLLDGWVRTGDIGYLDDDGYLFLADRGHDTITVDGTRVYPSEIEEVLTAHPAVAQCAVFGMRRDDTFEHVHAAIVPARGHSADIDDLRRFVEARKSALHVPHTFHVLKAIPLSGIGKPDKHALRRALS
ncbi:MULTISPECIES: AMP-binding protein [Streptomyces]|uniref:AMP-binding protein n=2 Tax=Streptomyces TaxID=1883 RepID=A0ABU4JZF1_9ACTN|nr:AMP-binding protein [Streptomyces roseolus]MDX2290878.1 AMP-binding protein [Streptomyces roseolus]